MNKLIFGKNDVQRIVSVEVTDSSAELFFEGNTPPIVVPNRYWILSPQKISGSNPLKGDLHYKYGVQFKERSDFINAKRKLKDKDTYSIYDPKESLMVKDGITYFKGMKLEELSALSFDLETTTLNPKDPLAKILIISNTFYKNGVKTKRMFCYDEYGSQEEMIEDWCKYVIEMNPSALVGHNVLSFDLPYLYHMNNDSLPIGRNGSSIEIEHRFESNFRVDGTRDLHYHKVKCYGREIIDTMFLSYKYDISRKYSSYGLKTIIKEEGLEQQGRVFYDASQIRENYLIPEEWEKIKQYCEDDSNDGLTLFHLMAPPFFYMTQSIPKSFQSVVESATGSQLNSIMVRSYLQEGHSVPKADEMEKFEGAISWGRPGVYKNCFKLDVASLYPSVMLQYSIYPRHKDPEKNFLKILSYFRDERLKNKKLAKETGDKYYSHLEQSQKISINSMYGFMGAPGLNFNYAKGAAEVTKMGREILMKAIKWACGEEFSL